jgi:PAS domain S-box-containing protein
MTKKPTYEELEQRIKELEKVGVEHKRVEVALTESEEKYSNLFHRSNDAIFIHDLDGNIIDANQRVLDLFGYKKSEMSSIRIPAIHPAESLEKSKWAFETIIREGFINFEIEFKKKSDEVFSAEVSSSLFEIGGKQVIQGIVRDITDRKRAEEALQESEEKLFRSKKMESLGLLAGGVAHDLNNVLSGIVSYPEIILMDLPEGSKLRKPVKTILESGLRAVAIVQDLLTVARGVATAKERLNLNDLIGDYLNSPEFKKLEQFHPGITVKTNLDSDLMNISSSHVHIRKVLMNLVSNATEAIEGRGNVTISTTNRYIDRPLRAYDDVNIGEYAILAVSDDGSGISSDDLERIFEPFYTKKVMGRSGTGLGLAVIWNILQDHKGYIDVINHENGTTFELYFPITRDEVMYKDPSIPLEDLKGDGETILVVDDVESQREISCDVLDSLGYRTKSVSSGEEAVEYLKEHTVDLLLLDMIMAPGINGRETYERIIKIHPNQKAIIVSGFAETGEVKGAQQLGAGQYVKKPLTLKKIGIAVKEELDK